MKNITLMFVFWSAFASSSLIANVAPEFRHRCENCCVAGANPGTYSICEEQSKLCGFYCEVECGTPPNRITFGCGHLRYTLTGCTYTGYEVFGVNTCSVVTLPSTCDFTRDGYDAPCNSLDCQQKRKSIPECGF